jgi:hypothetical protein
VGASFGILIPRDFPNSTPFDGVISRARLVVYPRTVNSPATVPVAIPVEIGPSEPASPPASGAPPK